jgi:DNA replication protein DnaC
MKYMLEHSSIPKNKQCVQPLTPDNCDIDAFKQLNEIKENIFDFVNEGKNLYIWSHTPGNGKTTWSTKILLQFFDSVWHRCGFNQMGLFVNVPTYLSRCKLAISAPDDSLHEIQKGMFDAPLVVFDDVSVSQLSNYEYTMLYSFIDSRIFSEKSTIFTGNYSPEELKQVCGDRLASRICSGVVIELKGKDMR